MTEKFIAIDRLKHPVYTGYEAQKDSEQAAGLNSQCLPDSFWTAGHLENGIVVHSMEF